MNNKVIVAGLGKSGSSYFMKLLTVLGLDTGFTPEHAMEMNVERYPSTGEIEYRGHRSSRTSNAAMPYIIKDSELSKKLQKTAQTHNWTVDHVYILLRDLEDVGTHRYDLDKTSGRPSPKTIFPIPRSTVFNKEQHINYLKMKFSSWLGVLLIDLAEMDVPHTLILFPRSATDPEYLFQKLSFLLKDMPYETFLKGFNKIADPKQIHYDHRKEVACDTSS